MRAEKDKCHVVLYLLLPTRGSLVEKNDGLAAELCGMAGGPASRNDNTNGPGQGRMTSYLPARLLGRVETNMHWKWDIPVEKLSRALCSYSTQRDSLDHKDKFSEARTCVKLLVHMLSLTITLRVVAWSLTHVGTHTLAELLPEPKGELWLLV